MKHTIIAGILFAILLFVVAFNGFYVRSVTDELCDQARSLPANNHEFMTGGKSKTFDLILYWKEKRELLAYSIHENELQRIDSAVAELYGAATADDYKSYCIAKERFFSFVQTLADGEKVSLGRIF
ncbi:MAG: DUF4363 family protein [Clostridia bacterium]